MFEACAILRRFEVAALAVFIAACGSPGEQRDAGVDSSTPDSSAPDSSGPDSSTPESLQPEGWADEVLRAPAVDLNPDPRTIEINLVAREAELSLIAGGTTRAWTYDGRLPGPHIDARVGDRLIVHFRNELPESTTIHWHGVRVPNDMDGAPNHPRPPIEPGASFDYDFVLRDEGLYWFHPHQNSAAQVAAGLYGTILVRADDEPTMDELVLVLSDMSLTADGTLMPPTTGGDLATLFGREGNYIFVNGRVLPSIRARNGVPLRLRIVNAAISRYFQLAIEGHRFTIIGGDSGLSPTQETVDRLVIMPGQRRDAILVPEGSADEELVMRWVPYDRGFGSTELREEVPMLGITLDGAPLDVAVPTFPSRTVTPISLEGATHFDVELTQNTVDGRLVMGIDGMPSWNAEPIRAEIGDTHVWTMRNTMEWAHPIHMHGFFFQALDERGVPIAEWRDTIDVRAVDGVARFAVHYDERPGMWMFHCHILDHADAGMMGMIEVVDGTGSAHAH
jgi:FtsP/CotA-like multicopper oxidase with cupredoxin domain